jgi:hypothetical protein
VSNHNSLLGNRFDEYLAVRQSLQTLFSEMRRNMALFTQPLCHPHVHAYIDQKSHQGV